MSPGPVRVMIVDDHAFVRSAIRQALTTRDVEVVAEAASVALDTRPDVLLLDVDLPGMTGIRLLRDLVPRLPDTRVVMLTVSNDIGDAVAALRLGAAGYLTKDIDADALLRAVRGARDGDLTMPRRLAARAVREIVAGTGGTGSASPEQAVLAQLSARELEILRLLAMGMTDREIGEALTISIRTVETHVSNILRKLDVRNRSEATRRFIDRR
jgi:DNA-binding NarL/FixJ family response regulator